MKQIKKIFFISLTMIAPINAMAPTKMVITEPVVSLRTAPQNPIDKNQEQDITASKQIFGKSYDFFMKFLPASYRDPRQDSQLLYNERIVLLEELPNDWIKIQALEQCHYNKTTNKWECVPGFIKKDQAKRVEKFKPLNVVICSTCASVSQENGKSICVPFGTKLHGGLDLHNQYKVELANDLRGTISPQHIVEIAKNSDISIDSLRKKIVGNAKLFMGSNYGWGNRCLLKKPSDNTLCGTDCSGLVNLAYRAAGLEIPRNTHAMYQLSNKIKLGKELQPGDCIFLAAAENPERMIHVLMYIGNDQVIESCIAKGVAITPAKRRFGKMLSKLRQADQIESNSGIGTKIPSVIYFGSFLNKPKLVQQLVDYAQGNFEIIKNWN